MAKQFLFNSGDGAAISVWNIVAWQFLIFRSGEHELAPSGGTLSTSVPATATQGMVGTPSGSNTQVGWASGILGFAQIFAAVIASAAADSQRLQRKFVVRTGCVFGFIAIVVSLCATFLGIHHGGQGVTWFYGACVLWGYYRGFTYPATEAIFTGSVPKKFRTEVFSLKWSVVNISFFLGYLVNIILYLIEGNHWADDVVQIVVVAGLGLQALVIIPAAMVRDEDELPELKEEPTKSTRTSTRSLVGQEDQQAIKALLTNGGTTAASIQVSEVDPKQDEEEETERSCLCFSPRWLPYLVASEQVISVLGSGMTVRFFPLFFIHLGVSPIAFNLAALLTTILTSLFSVSLQRLARSWIGRGWAILFSQTCGMGALYFLCFCDVHAVSLPLLLAVWIFRYAAMNCQRGIARSIIMDNVPANQRTRWNAVESVCSFSWAASAVVGGYIIDSHGYQFGFLVTAGIQTVATLLFLPVAALTFREWV